MFMGVTMSQPMETCTPKYKFSILVAYIHIGVGSNVVCSTTIGSARASIRGTDNRQFPRFFYVRIYYRKPLSVWGRARHRNTENTTCLNLLHIFLLASLFLR